MGFFSFFTTNCFLKRILIAQAFTRRTASLLANSLWVEGSRGLEFYGYESCAVLHAEISRSWVHAKHTRSADALSLQTGRRRWREQSQWQKGFHHCACEQGRECARVDGARGASQYRHNSAIHRAKPCDATHDCRDDLELHLRDSDPQS